MLITILSNRGIAALGILINYCIVEGGWIEEEGNEMNIVNHSFVLL